MGAIPITSYPRLTLDFHTNKRVIDEVVRLSNRRTHSHNAFILTVT